ncbi:MAG TPA: hypothetical protein VED46_16965 [Alphaproteobacteria bacterium]|nr:hypothetical protein [Alphaproteobacteria bacterium]
MSKSYINNARGKGQTIQHGRETGQQLGNARASVRKRKLNQCLSESGYGVDIVGIAGSIPAAPTIESRRNLPLFGHSRRQVTDPN